METTQLRRSLPPEVLECPLDSILLVKEVTKDRPAPKGEA